MTINRQVAEIRPFIVMDVLERAQELERTGHDVVHLEVGEPDFDAPEAVKEAAIRALRNGETHYTHSLGILELREAICDFYEVTYGIKGLDPDQIVITSGTSPAFIVAFSLILEPGDEIILSDPGYACYPNFARFVGAIPRFLVVKEIDGFQYDLERVRTAITNRTKAIMINSPSNPTGQITEPDQLRALSDMGLWLFSDEIYHGLVYNGARAHSALEFTDRCFVFNGFSKLYAMTGLRLGYIIVPKMFVKTVKCMVQNLFISANSVSQRAAYEALTNPEVSQDVERMVQIYDERRRFMVRRLKEIGFGVVKEPKGAFYVFANASRFEKNSYKLAFDILEKAHVGVTPGIDFGPNGEGFLRFSYANSLDRIKEGLRRIEEFLGEKSL
ncbi:MAG: pyridoxal phosphate-dependent aminotransferase [Syntrophobacterales bacterium]|nr:pyridoxal phosphate-dependent aminotransferase [Syntrophobacterales bacterium]